MRIRSTRLLLTCFLLTCCLTTSATACEPDCGVCCHWVPPSSGEEGYCTPNEDVDCGDCAGECGPCYTCSDCSCEWDCTAGQCCNEGGCVDDCPAGKCCSNGECVGDCPTGKCCSNGECVGDCPTGKCCSNGECVDDCPTGKCCVDGECSYVCPSGQECCGGSCITKCDYYECMECDDASGSCVYKCSGTTPNCNLGLCVECRDLADCDICEECVGFECEHPCDDCAYTEYCGYACTCVECTQGDEDTTTCSTSNTPAWGECDCSMNPVSPCGGTKETIIYSGNPLESCTGDDCEIQDVLCYTTYDGCEVSGSYKPLLWCMGVDTPPPICNLVLDLAGPGCYDCVHDPETGLRTNADSGVCPTEDWPDE